MFQIDTDHIPQHTVLWDQHEILVDKLYHFPDQVSEWEQPEEGYPRSFCKYIINQKIIP